MGKSVPFEFAGFDWRRALVSSYLVKDRVNISMLMGKVGLLGKAM